MDNECVFSDDRKYRYTLHHEWCPNKPTAAFIGLNPSTADEQELDPTLRRIRGFCESWGFGSFTMLNLFAFRATDPRDMKSAVDPIGPMNDDMIVKTCMSCNMIIACWGNHGSFMGRSKRTKSMLTNHRFNVSYLKMTKAGEPSHPLYLSKSLKPILWIGEVENGGQNSNRSGYRKICAR